MAKRTATPAVAGARRPRAGVLAACLLVALAGCAGSPPEADRPSEGYLAPAAPAGRPAVLVFTRTAGFRHASIPAAADAVRRLGREAGLAVDVTEDPARFSDAGLRGYRAVVFLHTTGHVLGAREQAALERFVGAGGGWVGVHAAADADPGWPWQLGLIGAEFTGHPPVQQADVLVEDPAHPSTRSLPRRWTRTDEWYNFRASPRGRARVLLTLDEATYQGGTMGADHPVAWCRRYAGGRSWYTALGHTEATWRERPFLEHLLGGIRWAAGLVPGSCDRSSESQRP
ncbi:MAG TPA: ThuA domain-containing protein [Actinomycetes bacterium]|nr:ThuA domain-containing protein [Actinomycetes bacterium]